MNLPEVITHCYCCVYDTESHMLQCKNCKRLFHPSCLKSDRPSNLVGDIFFKFTCVDCSEDGEECIERMKLQWIHVVVLTLYNLQLQGGGKCGYFRWREHICNFIDHNWNTFFKGVRKKTTTWHGTVAGTLSQGCPQFFRSGTEVLGESGWWALNNNRLPTLQELEPNSPNQKPARRSKVTTLDSSPVVGGLRMRKKTSIIQAAVELKEKKLIVQEKKKLRTSKGAQKAHLTDDDMVSDSVLGDETEELGSTSKVLCPQVKLDNQAVQSFYSSDAEIDISQSKGKRRSTDFVKVEDNTEVPSSVELHSSSDGINSVHEWLKMEVDEMEDLEIDFESTADIYKPTPPHMNELLTFMPEVMSKEETDIDETDVEDVLEETGLSDIKEENMEESEDDTKDSLNNIHSTQVSSVPEVGRKRKAVTREVTVTKEKQIQQPKCMLMNCFEEEQLLKKLEKLSEAVERNPTARRLRRKLIVRQLKRDANLPLFNIDMEIQSFSETVMPVNEVNQDIFKSNQDCTEGVDYRILDRFQVGNTSVQSHPYRHASFVTRLMGFEDTQKDCIISPYTTRVLQPLIFRDYESLPLKLKLLQEIVHHYHRADPKWTAPQRHPIVYCYVRPHHIPIVNALCHEFFWPGIDLSECLEYPDFSCISLYKKVIIGFAFMVPDVKYNEAYISFIFTHPEWRRAGIATFMLYHLIQTCMGKDVTLHVSATNPALFLYQKFGFKIEEFILDFYEKYHPPNSQECRHAMFLRLSR